MSTDRSFVKRVSRPVAAVLLLSGCFHYVPADVTPLPGPRTEVRITLSQPMDIPMGEFTLNEVTHIEGIVSEANRDTLALVARWLHPRLGRKYDALYGSYGIPASGIQQLETWRFAPKRTAIVLGAVALAGVFFLDLVARAVSGTGFLPFPGGDQTSVVAPR